MLFLKWNSKEKHDEIELTSAFSASPYFIYLFLAIEINLQTKRQINQVCAVRLNPGLYLFLFPEYGPIFCKMWH